MHPAITINDFTYRGDIDFVDIREAICAAYHERPNHCNLGEIWANESGLKPYADGEGMEYQAEDKRKKSHMKFEYLMILLVGIFLA